METMQMPKIVNEDDSRAKVSTIRVKSPEYGNFVMIAYEGTDVGTIWLPDIDKNKYDILPDPRTCTKICKDGFMFVDRTKEVIESMQKGAIKHFSDINGAGYNNNPPLKVYKMSYIF
jgi:hypothetical protein